MSLSAGSAKYKTQSSVSTSDQLCFLHIFLRTGKLYNCYQGGTFSKQDIKNSLLILTLLKIIKLHWIQVLPLGKASLAFVLLWLLLLELLLLLLQLLFLLKVLLLFLLVPVLDFAPVPAIASAASLPALA